jgi:hypothetical protein
MGAESTKELGSHETVLTFNHLEPNTEYTIVCDGKEFKTRTKPSRAGSRLPPIPPTPDGTSKERVFVTTDGRTLFENVRIIKRGGAVTACTGEQQLVLSTGHNHRRTIRELWTRIGEGYHGRGARCIRQFLRDFLEAFVGQASDELMARSQPFPPSGESFATNFSFSKDRINQILADNCYGGSGKHSLLGHFTTSNKHGAWHIPVLQRDPEHKDSLHLHEGFVREFAGEKECTLDNLAEDGPIEWIEQDRGPCLRAD